ncbi:multicopper oxidase family protein [Intrasporangium calvum]|uniref:multicopper oxidase family protein n=1 Tax=Intrasporangium calvum TaxID=53358 RepID=UPI000DF6303E|nr:multicopper oxidase family protein [Intrasporangium calvum]AXG14415.1 multicopper oxidase family protein [Intrasporangium calvum]
MNSLSRRSVILGSLGIVATGTLAACSASQPAGTPTAFGTPTAVPTTPGQRVTTAKLIAKRATLDLGGPEVGTWAYGDTAPGPLIRATAGDLVRVTLDNQLPADTSIHWHGIALANAADGVPGMTQDPIRPSTTFTYEFVAPDPGTYFYHPHSGVQLDRGLYAALIVDDPQEPGGYDLEYVVVLDDWVDGTGRTPDDVLTQLIAKGGSATSGGMGGMGGMDHGSMGMGGGAAPFGDAGDVQYPHYLINGRVPAAPDVLAAKPGQRVRLRVINAASDTIFTVALGGHRMTVTHSDGFPVQPTETGAFYIGMGERYDAVVTLKDGVFPLVAAPFGKQGQALALVRTGAGAAPPATLRPDELAGPVLLGTTLVAAESARLAQRDAEATEVIQLNGQMAPYQWGINGGPFGENEPIVITKGERVHLDLANMTMMTHPFHIHGHTFGLLSSGLRKDTVLLRPMETIAVELQADNAGDWAAHCHNIYHAEAGMMIGLNYRA